jgi:hypothetical protein
MKPILIVVVIVMAAFPFAMANAQSGWNWQNPLPQGIRFLGFSLPMPILELR